MAGRFGAILSSLSLAAGQSVRRNAGDSAFEAYTPFNSATDTIAYTQVNNLATARLVGRSTAGTGALEAISIGSGLSLSAGTLSATGGGLSIGSAVTGGGANRLLYEDGSQNLASSANLTFDGTTLTSGKAVLIGDTSSRTGTDAIFTIKADVYGGVIKLWEHLCNGGFSIKDAFGVAIMDYNVGTGVMSMGSGRQFSAPEVQATGRAIIDKINDYTGYGGEIHLAQSDVGFRFKDPYNRAKLIQAYSTAATRHLELGYDTSNYLSIKIGSTGAVTFDAVGSGAKFTFSDDVEIADAKNLVLNSTTGTKIGTATSQKLAFYNSSPIVQVTTGVTGAKFTANSGTAVNDASTFDGYTIGQIVKALRNYGLLA